MAKTLFCFDLDNTIMHNIQLEKNAGWNAQNAKLKKTLENEYTQPIIIISNSIIGKDDKAKEYETISKKKLFNLENDIEVVARIYLDYERKEKRVSIWAFRMKPIQVMKKFFKKGATIAITTWAGKMYAKVVMWFVINLSDAVCIYFGFIYILKYIYKYIHIHIYIHTYIHRIKN